MAGEFLGTVESLTARFKPWSWSAEIARAVSDQLAAGNLL